MLRQDEDDPSLPDADVFLQQQDKVELTLLHGGPLAEVQHVRAEEDDETQQHQLGGVLQSAVGYSSEHFRKEKPPLYIPGSSAD